jgi:hypothetical protein
VEVKFLKTWAQIKLEACTELIDRTPEDLCYRIRNIQNGVKKVCDIDEADWVKMQAYIEPPQDGFDGKWVAEDGLERLRTFVDRVEFLDWKYMANIRGTFKEMKKVEEKERNEQEQHEKNQAKNKASRKDRDGKICVCVCIIHTCMHVYSDRNKANNKASRKHRQECDGKTCVYIYTYIHTYIHAYTYVCIHRQE